MSKKSKSIVEQKVTKEPSFMIQVGDAKVLRRDILESLREIIIFMQGYETFKKVQEEKNLAFVELREHLRQINGLVNNHLSKYLPKGKLRGLVDAIPSEDEVLPKKIIVPIVAPAPKVEAPKVAPAKVEPLSQLEELESQLKDIEKQLQGI